MNEYYKFLGVSQDATDEEIEQAYSELRAKFSKDRFAEGEAGNNAAKNLTKLEEAYSEIMDARKGNRNDFEEKNSSNATIDQVAEAIKNGYIDKAQSLLDTISVRTAEWHYLQSVVFYKKNWINDSKKQLEIAINMDPSNTKYKEAYNKLLSKMNYTNNNFNNQFYSGNSNYQGGGYTDRQMGGDGCLDCCTAYCCSELLCSMCCGRWKHVL